MLTGQSIDTYVYRSALELSRFSYGAALEVLRSLIHLVLFAAAAFPAAVLLKRLLPGKTQSDPARTRDQLISLIPSGGIAALLLGGLLCVSLLQGVSGVEWTLLPNTAVYTALALATAFVNTVMCFLLARPAACGGRIIKPVMTTLLIILTAISMAAVSYGEYIVFRSIGMFHTWLAVALSGIGSVWGVWPLVFAARGMGVSTSTDWFRRMWKPAIALFLIQAAIQANNAIPSAVYLTPAANNAHPLTAIRNLLFTMPSLGVERDPTVSIGLILFMALIIPVALLLIVRTAFDETDNLAVFMPGK